MIDRPQVLAFLVPQPINASNFADCMKGLPARTRHTNAQSRACACTRAKAYTALARTGPSAGAYQPAAALTLAEKQIENECHSSLPGTVNAQTHPRIYAAARSCARHSFGRVHTAPCGRPRRRAPALQAAGLHFREIRSQHILARLWEQQGWVARQLQPTQTGFSAAEFQQH